MADRNKFEEMLERLINEDRDGAEELFHEIVVEKSRDIYEGLLESDLDIDEADDDKDDDDEDMEEGSYKKKKKDDDDEMSEDFDLDEFEVEGEDDMDMDMDMDMGGDATDDMLGDLEDGDDEDGDDEDGDDEDGDDEEMEDRVEDLEDALDDLKAEFEKMMAGEDGDEEDSDDDAEMDMDMDMDSDGDGEEGDEKEEALDFGEAEEDDEEDDEDEDMSEAETMREYVEKVTAKMGDDGANTQSTVASKNDMGGEAGNIAQGGESTTRKADSPKEEDMGNVNVPGGKASKSMKAQPKGHGAEKKGQGDTAANKKSTLGS